jgi:flagellar hook assembly protein FlgD
MKKTVIIMAMLAFAASQVFAADFVPTPMKISAPAQVLYNFDGSEVEIPVSITGTPAYAYLMVYTKDKGASIGPVQNGYLGWHYVNKIDTCVYLSEANQFAVGSHTMDWDGTDNDGNAVEEGEYSYYIWGFDNVTFKIPLSRQFSPKPWGRVKVVQNGEDGMPLEKPWILGSSGGRGATYEIRQYNKTKWIVGSDPDDASLLETCQFDGYFDAGETALLPGDYSIFFTGGINNNGGYQIFSYEWIPNGVAVLQTDWGEDGSFIFSVGHGLGWGFGPGCIEDGGDYLISANGDLGGDTTESEIVYIDINEGEEIQRLDLADWYVSLDDAEAEGQSSSGPTELSIWEGKMITGSHSSCMNLLFDIYYEDEDEAVLWANDNGDITGDHNWEETSEKPWVCNDYNVGPYKYNVAIGDQGFTVFPAYDMGAVSFGLYGPDGTGLNYQALSGETAEQKYDTEIIAYNSAYDGLMVSNNSATEDTNGWFWVGQDTFEGVITNQVSVEAGPAAISVAQNAPNPFNPTTTINFTTVDAGNVSIDVFNVAGQKVDTIANEFMNAGSHSVTWDASAFSAGVYFYTVKTGDFSKTMKMTLLK